MTHFLQGLGASGSVLDMVLQVGIVLIVLGVLSVLGFYLVPKILRVVWILVQYLILGVVIIVTVAGSILVFLVRLLYAIFAALVRSPKKPSTPPKIRPFKASQLNPPIVMHNPKWQENVQ